MINGVGVCKGSLYALVVEIGMEGASSTPQQWRPMKSVDLQHSTSRSSPCPKPLPILGLFSGCIFVGNR